MKTTHSAYMKMTSQFFVALGLWMTSGVGRAQESVPAPVYAVPDAAELARRAALPQAFAPDEALAPTVIVGGTWIPLGPASTVGGQVTVPPNNTIGGAIQALAIHPTNPDVVYIGSVNGGVWRTANATAASPTWIPLTDSQDSQSIGAVEFDPTDATSQTLVVGSARLSSYQAIGGALIGVLRTTDGGTNWSVLGGNFASENVTSVAARGAIIMAASDSTWGGGNGSGIFRTTNTGASFSLVSGTAGLPAGPVSDLVGDPKNQSRFFAAVHTVGIFRSDDMGATWTNVTSNLTGIAANTTKVELAMFNDGTSTALYAGVINSSKSLEFVWRSTNLGVTWTRMDTPYLAGQGDVHFAIATDRTNPALVYVGGQNGRFRGNATLAAGSQFVSIDGPNSANTTPHVDSREMFCDSAGTLIDCNDGGIYRRPSPATNGTAWVSDIGNLAIFEAHDVAYDSVNHTAMIGTQDNGTQIQTSSASTVWTWISGGDGGDVAIDDTSSPGQSIRYGSAQYLSGFYRKTYNSSNGLISTVSPAKTVLNGGPPLTPPFYTPVELNKVNPTHLIIGGANATYESLDRADTITALTPYSAVNINASGPVAYGGWLNGTPNADILYYGSGNTVKVRAVAGGAVADTAAAFPGGIPQDIVLDRNDYRRVFVAGLSSIYLGSNSGATWTNITGNLTGVGTLHTLEFFSLGGSDCVAVGTDLGVYCSFVTNLGVWNKLGTGLPTVLVNDMTYNAKDGVLVIGTLGRSAFILGVLELPIVTTPTSSPTTATTANLGGNVTSDGGTAITERGAVYSVASVNADPLIGGTGVTKITSAGTTGVFTASATGLTQGTQYSFKAYATNSEGTTYTTPVSTFVQGTPTVITPTSASITPSSAALGGNVTSDGGTAITERGVVYSATTVNADPLLGGTGVTKLTSAGTTGVFTVNATGLTNTTGYSFRVYATNSVGTVYTTPVSTFATPSAAPTVTTPTQTAITTNSATLGGNVTNDGGAAITERGVVYSSTNADPLIGGPGVTRLTGSGTTGVFNVNVTGLTQNTGYSFKAYAINSAGTTYTTPVSTFSTLVAVPITGTKMVGTGGDYPSLTNAGGLFEAINGNGVNGALNIQIISDLTSETGAVALNAMTGTTPSLKIFPTGAARLISGSIAGALIRFRGADNVTLDGALGGSGTIRSLTITNTSTSSPTVIALVSLGTSLGVTNAVIKNCNLSTGVATSTGYGIAVGGTNPGTVGADNDNVTIQNNSITEAPVGIFASGTASASSGGDDNLSIIGNSIAYNSTLASIGIQVGNARNSSVSQNTISEQTSSTGASTAISIETGFVSSSVARNTVTKSLTTSPGGSGSRGITVGTGTAASALTIANNIIYGVNGSNGSSFGGSFAMGIAIGTIGNSSILTTITGGVSLYYNSVSIDGSMGFGSPTAITAAIYIGSGASALDLRNNVFANTQVGTSTTQKNYAIYSAAASTTFTTIDYNGYYVTNTFNTASAIPGFLTSDWVNLAGIQAGFGQNTHSFTGDPLFISATDLHINSVLSPASNAGTPILAITSDFDGVARSSTNPDIGADEFVSPPIITTPTQTAIASTSATLGGNVTSTGGTVITERGVVYSITTANSDPLIGGTGVTKLISAGSTGIFTVNVTGLSAGTGYSFKAYAINSLGTTYTTPVSTFTTLTLQEEWRKTYFGITTNTGNAADTADPDADGFTNLFEYVAGLVPNDPVSRFKVRVEAVTAQPPRKAIIFSPLVAGRTYVVKSKASLSAATWTPLGSLSTSDNGAERTVTDLSATGATKFYQVEITLP